MSTKKQSAVLPEHVFGTMEEGDSEIGDGPREPFEAEAPDGPEALQNTIRQRRQLMARCWQLVEELRREEGDSVTIFSKVDGESGDGALIIATGDWCRRPGLRGDRDMYSRAPTTLEALEKAVAARRKAETTTDPTTKETP